jgi:hypothetical protein
MKDRCLDARRFPDRRPSAGIIQPRRAGDQRGSKKRAEMQSLAERNKVWVIVCSCRVKMPKRPLDLCISAPTSREPRGWGLAKFPLRRRLSICQCPTNGATVPAMSGVVRMLGSGSNGIFGRTLNLPRAERGLLFVIVLARTDG